MLNVQHLTHTFPNAPHPILRDISLSIREGEIICLLGASGSGKTTLLRLIAGLEPITTGEIKLNNKLINQVPAHQRGFGFMFQDYALFPHLDVESNIAFGLKMQRRPKAEQQQRVREVLTLVGLAHFANRRVDALSGGEQQRVALARSLAPQPHLLMLDEPLGALDAALREQLALSLREILKLAGVTAIYVTHDQQEAFTIADQIAIMDQGIITQLDSPEILYLTPRNHFVANFLGLHNILPIESYDGTYAHTPVGAFLLETAAPYVLLHPAFLRIMNPTEQDPTAINLDVIERVFQGAVYQYTLRHTSDTTIKMTVRAAAPYIPQIGEPVQVMIREGGIMPLED